MLLHLADVSKSYPSPQGPSLEVLRDVSFDLAEGNTLAIVGPSGSGKSTLLNLLGALDRPSAGTVQFDGEELGAMSDGQLAEFRNRKIGFVFQMHHLLPQCTALENVLVPTLAGRCDRRAALERAQLLLEQVGLSDRMDHRPAQLSGGQQQRVAVARALIHSPRLLLADEPTGSLDRAACDQLSDLLCELNRAQDVAMIVVTHSMELARRMGRAMQLRDGRLTDGQG